VASRAVPQTRRWFPAAHSSGYLSGSSCILGRTLRASNPCCCLAAVLGLRLLTARPRRPRRRSSAPGAVQLRGGRSSGGETTERQAQRATGREVRPEAGGAPDPWKSRVGSLEGRPAWKSVFDGRSRLVVGPFSHRPTLAAGSCTPASSARPGLVFPQPKPNVSEPLLHRQPTWRLVAETLPYVH